MGPSAQNSRRRQGPRSTLSGLLLRPLQRGDKLAIPQNVERLFECVEVVGAHQYE